MLKQKKLAVFSHKLCWPSPGSPNGFATDGGFPIQMKAISEIFESTRILVPCKASPMTSGAENPLLGHNLTIVPLTLPAGQGWRRKLLFPFWILRNTPTMLRELIRADAIHTPIPGDVGTIGMLLAWFTRKNLFVRHCGNWENRRTLAECFWRWFMETVASRRNVMLATGGNEQAPSPHFPHIRWIFSTSLTEGDLAECAVERKALGQIVRIIIVGRQEEPKGMGVLIRALDHLPDSLNHVQVDIVGEGHDLPKFKSLVDERNLSERVTFHHRLEHKQVIELLKKADLFCFPTSASEGFPKAVLEALACGLPVIATKVSVIPWLLKQGCGVVLEERTPEALAHAISQCLKNEEEYLRQSQRATEVAREYSLENWKRTIEKRLEENWSPSSDTSYSSQ